MRNEGAVLFVGALFADGTFYESAVEKLKSRFGPVAMETPSMPWNYSDHYASELGGPIMRKFVFFGEPIRQDTIGDIKLYAGEIEASLSENGRRRVNLDPGYLTEAKVVLASKKDYSHRVCLGKGIFAEVTLLFRDGVFRPHLYTYRDYVDYADVFLKARKTFRGLIASSGGL